MTPEQEYQVLNDVGELKAEVKESRAETKKALNLITGNGRPEDGILYILTDIRRQQFESKEFHRAHLVLHDKISECIDSQADRLTALETEEAKDNAVDAAKKKTLDRVVSFAKSPLGIAIITGIVAALTGWNKEVIAKGIISILGG